MLSIIVAVGDGNNAIGAAGDLLCHLPDDLRHFKETTAGHTVIMGKRTWFSLPKHPLPGRKNIVISDLRDDSFEGAETVWSINEAMALIQPGEEAFVIGGGMVYRQFMPIADKLYITHLHHLFTEADTFFPEINPEEWRLTSSEAREADERNPVDYTFATYVRR